MATPTKPLLIISGPSGVGKSYLDKLLKLSGLQPVINTTTRDIRPGEVDGVDYEFLTKDQYINVRNTSTDFVTDCEFFGAYYAVRQSEIDKIWADGKIPYMYIYIGVIEIFIEAFPYSRRVYLMPRDIELIERRLKQRDGDKYNIRLKAAKAEIVMFDSGKNKFYHNILPVVDDDTGPIVQALLGEASDL